MEKYQGVTNMGTYAERAIYEEIIANLDGSALDASEVGGKQENPYYEFEGCEENEDPRLRYVMNDHNYILNNRKSQLSLNVRQSLLDFVKINSALACSNSGANLEKLIDNILNLLRIETNYDSLIGKFEFVCKSEVPLSEEDDKVSIHSKEALDDPDPKPPNQEQTDEKENTCIDEIKIEEEQAHDIKSEVSLKKELDSIADFKELCDAILGEDNAEATDNVDSMQISNILPDNKVQITQNEKETTQPSEKEDTESKIKKLPEVVNNLLLFAEKLKEDCISVSEKLDFNLENFISFKSKEYKSIIDSVLCRDASVQTEKKISRKKLRKLNAQDKRHLLESSNDSSSTTVSDSDKSLSKQEMSDNSKKTYKHRHRKRMNLKSKPIPPYSESNKDSTSSDTNVADKDTCNSPKELAKSPFSGASHKSNDSSDELLNSKQSNNASIRISKDESDKENSFFAKSPQSKSNETNHDVSQDKEIKRLLNLDCIAKQKNALSNNSSKPQNSLSKSLSKSNSLYEVAQEIDTNSLSDDSVNKEDQQILTEKQLLAKFSENFKQQLLNSASSDSDNSESDIDLNAITKSNNLCSEERLSNVEKFLETLTDNEDSESIDNKSKSVSSPKEKIPHSEETSKSNESLPNTNPITDPKNKEQSLNDKPQKDQKGQEDLIDLSDESCNSDVEEYSVETKEKSQRIKPMLRRDQLESETLSAQNNETERLERLEKKNNFLQKLLKSGKKNIKEDDLVLDYITASKTFIKVHPDIVKHLKPHQRDGVKFMYDSCYGCVDDLSKNSGSGCILAHCMGLGKTLQIIALLHTVTSYKELKTSKILVLCPKSTIMNWVDETQRWLGPLNERNIKIYSFSDTADIYDKVNVLRQWCNLTTKASCLVMGYEAFRSLVFYHSNKSRTKQTTKVEDIQANIKKLLLKPGADLVICDEGHIIKNRKSGISLAAAEIVTPKRIVLTGTPIQNNLKEYYSMVNFIKPLILGTEKEFANLYANPIKNGQHKDSSKRDIKVMKQRSFVLHKKLSKFVQRKEAVLLQSFLPQKFEYVLFIPMTDVQNNLYEYVLEAISKREDSRGRSLITDYTCLRKIWTHPKVLENAWKNAIAAKNKKDPKKQFNQNAHSDDDQPDDIYDSQTGIISVQHDWWRSLVTEADLETIIPSNKLKTMFEIIRMSEENGEKCLIFSAFVAVLNVVEYFLTKISNSKRNLFMFDNSKQIGEWVNGKDYFRLDGKTNKTLRHKMIKRFNDPKNNQARLFLISARAGGQGINLIGANRVIILDTSWNPANDQQNIFRIFRLGQKKNCYVYRLIAMGTMEEKVYSRSVTKQAMSFRVVDEQQIDRHYNMAELAELYTLTKPCYDKRTVPAFPQDQILANLLLNFPDLVYKYHEHDSLLENKVEQELSEQEKADAWVAYERDLQLSTEPRDIMENHYGGIPMRQGNYMYPIGEHDARHFFPPHLGLNQMDIASQNVLGSSLLSNYFANRNSYFDLCNMYKQFSAPMLNEKNNRSSRFNSNYGMPFNPGANNTPPLSSADLSILAQSFYPLSKLPNTGSRYPNNMFIPDGMVPNPMSNLNQMNLERNEQNKLMSAKDNAASPLSNFPVLMPPITKDLTDSIPRNVISKNKSKVTTNAPLTHMPTSKTTLDGKVSNSLLKTQNPRQSITPEDSPLNFFEKTFLSSLNMGAGYPKQPSYPLSPVSERNDERLMISENSAMQVIPTNLPLKKNIERKSSNMSPNILREQLKEYQSKQPQRTSNSSPSGLRKRRNSVDNSSLPEAHEAHMNLSKNLRTSNVNEQPSYPPKVFKY